MYTFPKLRYTAMTEYYYYPKADFNQTKYTLESKDNVRNATRGNRKLVKELCPSLIVGQIRALNFNFEPLSGFFYSLFRIYINIVHSYPQNIHKTINL